MPEHTDSRLTDQLQKRFDETENLVKILQKEHPEVSEEKIASAIERCSLIIPTPRHHAAFLQTLRWYIKSILLTSHS